MSPKILFIVPSRVAQIADICADFGATIEFEESETGEQAAQLLDALVGRVVTVKFPLPIDPLDRPFDAVETVAKILDREGSPYVYFVDAFEEPTRGLRVRGRIVVKGEAGPYRYDLPWEQEEPKLDVATLCASGMEPHTAEALVVAHNL